MKKYITKKILIIIACAFFALLPLASYPSQTKAADTSQYYGYQCKRHILEELAKHPEIPEWKQMETIGKLSADGYFWLTTVEAKKFYLHTHDMKNLVVLRITAQVEERYGWHVPSAASSMQTQQSVSSQEYYFGEANKGYQNWVNFVYNLCKAEGGIYEYGTCKIKFLNKDDWRKYGGQLTKQPLDDLYAWWPDLKKQYGGQFTAEEKRRLEQIWKVGNFDKLADDWAKGIPNAGSIGFTGNSPWDDVLLFVPVEKLVAPVAKFALKPVAKAGSWLLKKAGGGIATGVRRAVASKVAKTLINRVAGRFSGRTYEINLARIFIDCDVSVYIQKKVTNEGVDALEGLAYRSSYGKYFPLQKLISIWQNMKILSDDIFHRVYYGYDKSVLGVCDETCVVIKESAIESGHGASVIIHESLHARSSITTAGRNQFWIKAQNRYPLEEGFTEYFSDDAMRQIYGYKSTTGAYMDEKLVVKSIRDRLIRKWSQNGANKQAVANADNFLQGCYFESKTGDLSMLDQQFGTGFHDIISAKMSMKKYGDAIKMIDNWTFPKK